VGSSETERLQQRVRVPLAWLSEFIEAGHCSWCQRNSTHRSTLTKSPSRTLGWRRPRRRAFAR
jgi:hypothetical protein